MRRWSRTLGIVGLGAVVVLTVGPASGFVLTNGRPSENVSGAGARSPGVMVGAGVGRHGARLDDFSSINDITQATEPPGFTDTFLPQWIDTIFTELNNDLNLLINALFLRAGQTPPALSQLANSVPATPAARKPIRPSLTRRSLDRLDRNLNKARR